MKRKLHRHDLSCEKDFSGNMGDLIPTHWRMCYPGDVVRERADFFVRVSPMLAPIISKVMIKAESFFVPTDVVWSNAQEFYSGGQDGTSTKVIPKMTVTAGAGIGEGTLSDYLGLNKFGLTATFNILPHRVYNSIWNWHYKDRDLQTDRVVSLADGPDTTTDITLAKRCWERDRFTTARLEPQRGDDVLIPMASTADLSDTSIPVKGIAKKDQVYTGTAAGGGTAYETDGTTPTYAHYTQMAIDTELRVKGTAGTGGIPDITADLTGVTVDLDSATGTIRELEEAVAINRFRKRLQQSDGSYPDYTLATFGIRSPDIELQKPVLLARSSSPLQISEVIQTSPDDGDTDPTIGVGTLFGHGIATARGHAYKYKVKRHGYIMTIFSVVPKTMYVQGNDKEWIRSTKEDYFDPDLDQIGEEIIENQEVYGGHSDLTGTFGYQYRNYCDRSALNTIGGEMRSTLNFWHQARSFSSDVALNSSFVTANPTDRIFALGSTVDQLRVKAMHEVKMLRTMRRIPFRGVL